jgi:mono/diheme cytochrome c family protein
VRSRLAIGLVALVAVTGSCNVDEVVARIDWFSTMRNSPAPRPYAQPRPPVEGTVPVTGDEVMVVAADEANRLVNPRPRTAESLNRGQTLYQTYCTVCHGAAGLGDGPISATNGRTPAGPFPGIPTLVDQARRDLTDGWIYGVVVSAQEMGKGLMPRYGDRVRGLDRWDIVNYVRQLQADASGSPR